MLHPTDKIAYTTAFVTPAVEHWLEDILRHKMWGPSSSVGMAITCGAYRAGSNPIRV